MQNVTKHILLFALTSVIALATTGCQNGFLNLDDDPQNETDPDNPGGGGGIDEIVDPGEEGTCTPLTEFYVKQVHAAFAQNQCGTCHAPDGAAQDSNFILFNEGRPDWVEANLAIMTEFAKTKRDGESVLLLKPMGVVAHGGGEVITDGDDSHARLKAFVERVEANTGECEVAPDMDFFDGVELLDDQETIRKASLNLAGRLPTQAEYDGTVDSALESITNDDAFLNRITEEFNDLLLTDAYINGEEAVNLLDDELFPNKNYYDAMADEQMQLHRREANRAIAREPVEMMKHVVRSELPFTEILTANYTMVNPFSARVYGVDGLLTFANGEDMNDWQQVQVPGVPHAGLLTSPVYLNRYPTTATNRNRHRSYIFQKYFLATDVLRIGDRPIDAVLDDQTQNPTLFSANCSGCHQALEPISGAFANFDEFGMYAPPELGWYPDMFPPGFNGENIGTSDSANSLQWLATRVTSDRRFVIAAIQHAYKLTTGGEIFKMPTDVTRGDYEPAFRAYIYQVRYLKELGEAFVASNYNFKALVREIVQSEYYRAKNVDTTDATRQLELSGIGTAVLLGPERLNRKITSVAGVEWRINDRNQLLSNNAYFSLYGGIDYSSTVVRPTELNSIGAGIARRMSNEVACLATANDFNKAVGERLLFPSVEVTDVPGASEAKIRENITHLYWHVLGEKVETNSEDVDIAYSLFTDVYNDATANGNGLNGRCQAGNINSDPDGTIRSWMAVMSYLFVDPAFLFE